MNQKHAITTFLALFLICCGSITITQDKKDKIVDSGVLMVIVTHREINRFPSYELTLDSGGNYVVNNLKGTKPGDNIQILLTPNGIYKVKKIIPKSPGGTPKRPKG